MPPRKGVMKTTDSISPSGHLSSSEATDPQQRRAALGPTERAPSSPPPERMSTGPMQTLLQLCAEAAADLSAMSSLTTRKATKQREPVEAPPTVTRRPPIVGPGLSSLTSAVSLDLKSHPEQHRPPIVGPGISAIASMDKSSFVDSTKANQKMRQQLHRKLEKETWTGILDALDIPRKLPSFNSLVKWQQHIVLAEFLAHRSAEIHPERGALARFNPMMAWLVGPHTVVSDAICLSFCRIRYQQPLMGGRCPFEEDIGFAQQIKAVAMGVDSLTPNATRLRFSRLLVSFAFSLAEPQFAGGRGLFRSGKAELRSVEYSGMLNYVSEYVTTGTVKTVSGAPLNPGVSGQSCDPKYAKFLADKYPVDFGTGAETEDGRWGWGLDKSVQDREVKSKSSHAAIRRAVDFVAASDSGQGLFSFVSQKRDCSPVLVARSDSPQTPSPVSAHQEPRRPFGMRMKRREGGSDWVIHAENVAEAAMRALVPRTG
ncbi:hypothetical protein J8273_0476 [Carpediemonas membranifera]|uniref:Uncharacterized protein n=1 Tax=Carpediemonas membranifera TaxID=201153 RepID=A0A8J6B6F7_9EUKA|nr:hypothetical protein J8273_0476 [Carpediemonas membranifera]|eukprot:KAG9395254.1 hypothetical protein J8273_0476 [Carpediemonas membranifera]